MNANHTPALCRRTTCVTWTSADGRELLRLINNETRECVIVPAKVNLDELRALHAACGFAITELPWTVWATPSD
jgi:hypothetical protein